MVQGLAGSVLVLLSQVIIQPDGKGNQHVERVRLIFHVKLILHLLAEAVQQHSLEHLLIQPRLGGQDTELSQILRHTARPLAEEKQVVFGLLPLHGVVKNRPKFCGEGRERATELSASHTWQWPRLGGIGSRVPVSL